MVNRRVEAHALQEVDGWGVIHGRVGDDQADSFLQEEVEKLVHQDGPDVAALVGRQDADPAQQATALLALPLLGDVAKDKPDDAVGVPSFSSSSFVHLLRDDAELGVRGQHFRDFEGVPGSVAVTTGVN